MTLTEADVELIRAAGQEAFFFVNSHGEFQLRNIDGHCIFLADERCSVHEVRPEGCRFYPFILNLGLDRVVRHGFCPWRNEFAMAPDLERQLRRSVDDERREAEIRKAKPREGRG